MSYGITHHPAVVTFPPSPQQSWYSIYRPRRDARLSWASWLVTYRDGYIRPKTITHPSTNQARRGLTSFTGRKATPLRHAANRRTKIPLVWRTNLFSTSDNTIVNCVQTLWRKTSVYQRCGSLEARLVSRVWSRNQNVGFSLGLSACWLRHRSDQWSHMALYIWLCLIWSCLVQLWHVTKTQRYS